MKQVTRTQYESLMKAGLINFSNTNRNVRQTGKGKPSKRRKYHVVESRAVLEFLKELEQKENL